MTGKGWTCPYSLALGEPTLCALSPLASDRGVTTVAGGGSQAGQGLGQEIHTVTWKVPAPTGQQRGLLSQGWGASQRVQRARQHWSLPAATLISDRVWAPWASKGGRRPRPQPGQSHPVPQSSRRKASAGDDGEQ